MLKEGSTPLWRGYLGGKGEPQCPPGWSPRLLWLSTLFLGHCFGCSALIGPDACATAPNLDVLLRAWVPCTLQSLTASNLLPRGTVGVGGRRLPLLRAETRVQPLSSRGRSSPLSCRWAAGSATALCRDLGGGFSRASFTPIYFPQRLPGAPHAAELSLQPSHLLKQFPEQGTPAPMTALSSRRAHGGLQISELPTVSTLDCHFTPQGIHMGAHMSAERPCPLRLGCHPGLDAVTGAHHGEL